MRRSSSSDPTQRSSFLAVNSLSLLKYLQQSLLFTNASEKYLKEKKKKKTSNLFLIFFMKKGWKYLFLFQPGFLACSHFDLSGFASWQIAHGNQEDDNDNQADTWTIRGQEFVIKFLLLPTDLKFLIILRRQLTLGKIQQSHLYQKPEGLHNSSFLCRNNEAS